MSYCRFAYQNATFYGLLESAAGNTMITRISPNEPRSLTDFDSGEKSDLSLDMVRLLPPVQPGKIVCIGRNYKEHAAEFGNAPPAEPLIFLKPPSSVIGPGDEIRRPADLSQRVDYEGELGVVIGKRCSRLDSDDDVLPFILGYTCVNDVTARDLQKKDGQWTRGKGFDTFCPVGPVVTRDLDPWKGIRVKTAVNGEVRQDGNTVDFIFPLDVIIRYVSQVMTLEAGDLIATGTPAGVGPVVAGDIIEVTIDGVGTLRNPVVDRV